MFIERCSDSILLRGGKRVCSHSHLALFSAPIGITQFFWKMIQFDYVSMTEYEGIFDKVFKFPDIARKIIFHKCIQDLTGDTFNVHALDNIKFIDKIIY